MDALALTISVIALVVALIALWRSGGRRRLEAAGRRAARDLSGVRESQRQLMDASRQMIRRGYETIEQRADQAEQRVRRSESADIGPADTTAAPSERQGLLRQLRRLRKRTRERIEALEQTALDAAQRVQRTFVSELHRLEARAELFHAQYFAQRALRSLSSDHPDRAARMMERAVAAAQAVELLLNDDPTHEDRVRMLIQAATMARTATNGNGADNGHENGSGHDSAADRIEQFIRQVRQLADELEAAERAAGAVDAEAAEAGSHAESRTQDR